MSCEMLRFPLSLKVSHVHVIFEKVGLSTVKTDYVGMFVFCVSELRIASGFCHISKILNGEEWI